MITYPLSRLRRTRNSEFIRDLVQENHVNTSDLVYPVFIVDGQNRQDEIKSLPTQKRLSIDKLLYVGEECQRLGVKALALFPMIETSKSQDSYKEAYNPDGLLPRAIQTLKNNFPELGVFTDIALDAYTHDGHDGISSINKYGEIVVENDATNAALVEQALCHAQAGADFVCPSDMMDGRILAIRRDLEANKLFDVGIMAYAAKYASSFYGPFRDATGAASNLGKHAKKTYQMNPGNSNEAIHEAMADLAEGADIIMVKPGLPYLDIVYRVKAELKKPTAVYHVSGEYAMLKSAHAAGYLDFDRAILETMLCFKRSGSDIIWTYAALEVAKLLKNC